MKKGGLTSTVLMLVLAACANPSPETSVPGGLSDDTMSADEFTYWQDLAALLDPRACEFVVGTSQIRTVPPGERWYLQEGWYLEAGGGGENWFHRAGDIRDAVPLSEGTVIQTDDTVANSHFYVCKPSLVTGSDARYTNDPRGLYFERLMRITELERFQIGGVQTDNGHGTAYFPKDFTNGLVTHVSIDDIAWLILRDVGERGGLIAQPEISDIDRLRYANNVLIPFVRADFPGVYWRGASQPMGRGTLTYVKLPDDW